MKIDQANGGDPGLPANDTPTQFARSARATSAPNCSQSVTSMAPGTGRFQGRTNRQTIASGRFLTSEPMTWGPSSR